MGQFITWEKSLVKDIVRTLLSGLALSLILTPSLAQAPASTQPPASTIDTSRSRLDTTRRPFYLTAGGLVPFSGNAVELGGVVYTSLGLSYFPTKNTVPAQLASGSRLGLRLDYARGQSNTGEVSSVGISPVYQRVGGRLRGNPILYGVSLGIFRTEAKVSATETAPKRSDSSIGLGGRLFAGMEFSSNVFAELSFNEFPGAMGARPRGFALHLGTRF